MNYTFERFTFSGLVSLLWAAYQNPEKSEYIKLFRDFGKGKESGFRWLSSSTKVVYIPGEEYIIRENSGKGEIVEAVKDFSHQKIFVRNEELMELPFIKGVLRTEELRKKLVNICDKTSYHTLIYFGRDNQEKTQGLVAMKVLDYVSGCEVVPAITLIDRTK